MASSPNPPDLQSKPETPYVSRSMTAMAPPDLALRGQLTPRGASTFRAFRHANFRLYFIGLLISVTGLWAQTVAQEWLVYSLTDSPLILGQVTFVMAIPVWIFGPWAGVLIDRMSRRKLLAITQTIQMLQAFALAALTFSGHIQVWHVMVLSAVRGFANAFDAPVRQTFVVEMVGKEDLSNAIALNSTMFSLARFAGPAVGALILATLGTAWAFTINGVTFVAFLIALALLKLNPVSRAPAAQSPFADLKEGLRFIWNEKTIAGLMVVALTVALFGSNFSTLMPVIARDVLGKGEVEFGLLKTANGLGSVLGTLLVTVISGRAARGKWLNLLNILFPLTLIGLAFSATYPLALITLLAVGASHVPQLSMCNMLIQSNIPDEIRGRVMSVYSLTIFGVVPLGALIGGAMADQMGAPMAILLNAGAVIVVIAILRLIVPTIGQLE